MKCDINQRAMLLIKNNGNIFMNSYMNIINFALKYRNTFEL